MHNKILFIDDALCHVGVRVFSPRRYSSAIRMSLSQQEKELAKIFLAEFNVLHTYCQNLITTPASAPGLVPRIMAFKIPRFDHVNPEYLKKHQCLISLVNDDISHLERLLHTLDPAEHAEHSAVKAKAVIMLVERIQKSIRRSVGERPAK